MTNSAEPIDVIKLFELGGIWFTAFVALFLPKLYRPRLRVLARPDGIGSTTYLTNQSGAGVDEELWFRIGVHNRSTLNAEDVQVRLILARERGRADRAGYRIFSSWWLKMSALPQTAISIPPKYVQYVDLCYLSVKAGSDDTNLFLVAVRPPVGEWSLEKQVIESEPKHRLEPFIEYDIVIAVSGLNTHASYWRVAVRWNRPQDGGERLHGEAALRSAVVFGVPNRVARLPELEDPKTLAIALGD